MWIMTLWASFFFVGGWGVGVGGGGVMPFIPLSDQTSKAMQGVVWSSFLSLPAAFALICEGTPEAPPPHSEPHENTHKPTYRFFPPSTRGAKCCVIWV